MTEKTKRCHSSVGRAKDWKSLCPRFDSWWYHLEEKQKTVKSWFPNEIGIFYFPAERKKRQNITVAGVPKGGAKEVERKSPPNKITSLWFAIFCVSKKRAWFPTFVQRKNCRNMKRNSFNVLFFIKKAKLLKNGEASVCMRITVNGARVENNIRKSIEPALSSKATHRRCRVSSLKRTVIISMALKWIGVSVIPR